MIGNQNCAPFVGIHYSQTCSHHNTDTTAYSIIITNSDSIMVAVESNEICDQIFKNQPLLHT